MQSNTQPILPRNFGIPILPAFACLALTACQIGGEDDVSPNGNDKKNDDETISEKDAGDDGGDAGPPEPFTRALVVTSDYQTGAYSAIALDDLSVRKDIGFIFSDTVCRYDAATRTPFLVMRFGSDAVAVLDFDTFDIETEFSVGANSNPNDIVLLSNHEAVVSRYGSAKMQVVDPQSGEHIRSVDLSAYADADGIPEIAGLTLYNDKLYVPVQRLDRNADWEPDKTSYVVVVDAGSLEIEKGIPLSGSNPYAALVFAEAIGQFVIAEPGSFSTLDDGGVEFLDPTSDEVSGFIITEQALGGNVTKVLVVSGVKAYALVAAPGENGSNTNIVIFNPKTGKKVKTLLEGDGWIHTNMVLTEDNSALWVTDQSTDAPGIRIFDAATDEELTDAPIDVGLPPNDICFTH